MEVKNFAWKENLSERGNHPLRPVECNLYQSVEDVPDPRELSSEKKNLMILDDLLLEKQNTCESYSIRGRHSNVDCFYLAQTCFKLPR